MSIQLSSQKPRSLTSSLLFSGLVLGGLLAGACKGEIEGGDKPETKPVEDKKSNIVKLTTAVPYGKHIACSAVLPETAPFTEKLGEGHEIGVIKDKSPSNSSATFVCSVVKAGDPPASPKELKTLEDKYAKLGVLPGDEYCMVIGYCSLANDDETFKRKCDEDSNRPDTLDGQFACVRATEKGAEYSYTYKFIEPDTKCALEVMAGPSVNEEAVVRSCALAARDAITKEGVANPLSMAELSAALAAPKEETVEEAPAVPEAAAPE
jgi:hypothetical protein